jgi:thiamine pyrophosphokinase
VREAAQKQGTKIVQISDQDSTDFEKCVNYLRTQVFPVPAKAFDILCLGGLGGRLDHGISQLHQLYREQMNTDYNDGRIYLLTSENITFVLKSGLHRICVKDKDISDVLGTHIGIIPLKGPSIITTKGLEWDVKDWWTEFGGQISTSNLVRENWVEILTTGDVLFTIELDFKKGQPELEEYYADENKELRQRAAAQADLSVPSDLNDSSPAFRAAVTTRSGKILNMDDDMFFGTLTDPYIFRGGEFRKVRLSSPK